MTDSNTHRGLPVRERRALGRVRKVMVQAMKDSVQRGALSQVTRFMDLTAVQAARQAAGEPRISLNVYLLAAVARTLPAHPLLNAELVDDKVVVFDAINLGLAIAVPDGLVVAVIRDADKKELSELSAAAADLAARARAGKLGLADIDGGTFTVSNLGMFGVDGGFPLPRPPEGAILLVGRTRPEPALIDGVLAERQTALFSLTFDHRFIDGAAAAAFLRDLQENLSSGEGWRSR
jgi:pyruvate dehydrogenase E2 component (dihydrolipoamide acetyltransferase)